MDNFYNSPELAKQLKIQHSTDCAGTLKLNRKNVPKEVRDKLKKGEIIERHSAPVTELKWCDKRSVTMVLTYHSADTQRVSKRSKETDKPLCVSDYNHNTGGVDLKLLHIYVVERKRMTKWYLKLFNRLLNSTVLNSIVVYRKITGRNIERLSYRIHLVKCLFTKYSYAAGERSVLGQHASDNTIPRLTERYFLRKVSPKVRNQNRRGGV
jgi:hypothetical protein